MSLEPDMHELHLTHTGRHIQRHRHRAGAGWGAPSIPALAARRYAMPQVAEGHEEDRRGTSSGAKLGAALERLGFFIHGLGLIGFKVVRGPSKAVLVRIGTLASVRRTHDSELASNHACDMSRLACNPPACTAEAMHVEDLEDVPARTLHVG